MTGNGPEKLAFDPGTPVQVSGFGKGVVREARNGRRYLVDVKGSAMVVSEGQLSPIEPVKRKKGRPAPAPPVTAPDAALPSRQRADASIDLHGLTVPEAEAAVEVFLNEALLAGLDEVRVIHGRSGGHLKAAVHARLRAISSIRGFRLDPKNEGVTIVSL